METCIWYIRLSCYCFACLPNTSQLSNKQHNTSRSSQHLRTVFRPLKFDVFEKTLLLVLGAQCFQAGCRKIKIERESITQVMPKAQCLVMSWLSISFHNLQSTQTYDNANFLCMSSPLRSVLPETSTIIHPHMSVRNDVFYDSVNRNRPK